MNPYQKAILEGRKQFLKLNQKQERELLNLYKDLSNQLKIDISNCRTTSSNAYLKNLKEIVDANIKDLNSQLKSDIKANIQNSSNIASSVESFYYEQITNDTSLKTMFTSMAAANSRQTVINLIQGNYYKDGINLNDRIWLKTEKNKNDINRLIQMNVLKGANARTLAKEVEKYVNPFKRTDAKTVVSGMSTRVSYEAQRLARTSITHAFAETTIKNAKTNPFNIGIKWELSASHERQDICDDYDGRIFEPDDVPIQHPNCLCHLYEVNEDINKAIEELKAWTKGESNPKLDEWYNKNNEYDGSDRSLSDIIKRRDKKFKPAKNVKKAEEYANKTLGIENVSYKGCDLTTANEWNKGLFDTFNKFPELKSNFGFVGECHERNKMLKPIAKEYYLNVLIKDNPEIADKNIKLLEKYAEKQVRSLMKNVSVSKNTFAQSWSPKTDAFKELRGITVNKDWGKDSALFQKVLKDNVMSKFHPQCCDSIRSVLDHEIGHQLDDLLGISKITEIQELFNTKTRKEITEGLSRYSWDNNNIDKYGEFIAEGWSEYCNNPNPRYIAKEIGKTIERMYKEWKKKNL